MRKIINGLLAVGFVCAGAWAGCSQAADAAAPRRVLHHLHQRRRRQPAERRQLRQSEAPLRALAARLATPRRRSTSIKATPQGGLHNPYNDQIDKIAEEGHKKYLSLGCNGCHGGGGGGGMCPPLTNDVWVYQGDDDTLFRLVSLGSDGLQKAGYVRVKHEVVVGPMPPFGGIIKTSDDLWKVIAWIRSVNPDLVKLEGTPYAKPNY